MKAADAEAKQRSEVEDFVQAMGDGFECEPEMEGVYLRQPVKLLAR